MSNIVLPTLVGMTFPVVKTPMWRTIKQEATSGKETSIGLWSFPRWKYSLAYEFLRNDPANAHDELWPLIGHFNAHYGSHDSWLFNDPDDNAVTDQLFGTGDGVTTVFQLNRPRGGFTEPVAEPNGAVVIKKATVVQAQPAAVSVGAHTGIVTFVSAPANGAALTWTGAYYWRCRFMSDTLDFSKFAALMWELKKLEFESVK